MDRMLTVEEVAEILRMSPDWVYKNARCGLIPHVPLGSGKKARLRFWENEVKQWLQNRHAGSVRV